MNKLLFLLPPIYLFIYLLSKLWSLVSYFCSCSLIPQLAYPFELDFLYFLVFWVLATDLTINIPPFLFLFAEAWFSFLFSENKRDPKKQIIKTFELTLLLHLTLLEISSWSHSLLVSDFDCLSLSLFSKVMNNSQTFHLMSVKYLIEWWLQIESFNLFYRTW